MTARQRAPFFILLFSAVVFSACSSPPGAGEYGVVVSAHPLATEIGLNVLKEGGNAVDAAIATGFAMGVVDQFHSGIGGGGFIVMRMAGGSVYTIDGRETAPAAATRNMFVRDGEVVPSLSQVGPLAVGVPGLLAAYDEALKLAGSKSLAELIAPSVQLAQEGFVLDSYYVAIYRARTEYLRSDSASARIYFHADGSLLEVGDTLKQPDLAATYQKIGEGGLDYFYRGEFAERLASFMAGHGGLITVEDMNNYNAKVRDPVIGEYRGYEIIGMAPPSSGGVHLLQMLNMIEASEVLEGKSLWDDKAIYWISRFMRQAFEDRAVYLGDADFYPVPIERLVSKGYADSVVNALRTKDMRVSEASAGKFVWASGGTTNLCVIDKWGNVVSVNQTVNLWYGAKITLAGTGVILNDEMDDFSAQPGAPNAFGLIGSEANSVAPGKRPLSSMSPTIVVSKGFLGKKGKPVLILGGAGGPKIITAVLQMIIAVLDFGMELTDAQNVPRFHHQFKPEVLYMEMSAPEWMRTGQQNLGQEVVLKDELGRVQAIALSKKARKYVAVPDPRGRASASGH